MEKQSTTAYSDWNVMEQNLYVYDSLLTLYFKVIYCNCKLVTGLLTYLGCWLRQPHDGLSLWCARDCAQLQVVWLNLRDGGEKRRAR